MISHALTSLVALALPALLFVPLAFAQSPGALRTPQRESLLLPEEVEEDRVSRARRPQGGARGAAMFAPERRTLDFAASGLWAAPLAIPQEPSAPSAPQQPAPYVHVSSTDVDDPNAFWYTHRDTIVGERATDEWDPLKLINTDRPDFTDVGATVGAGVVQIETGFVQIRKDDGETRTVTETIPNVLLRIGEGSHFEWRLKWRGYVRNEVTDLGTGARGVEEGTADTELGFKWIMSDQDDLIPMNTLVFRCNLPVGSPEATAHRPEPGLSYIYNWQIRRWWFLRGATGIDLFNQPEFRFRTVGGTPVVPTELEIERDAWLEWSQAFSSYMQVSKRVGIFKEWFMFKRHGSTDDHSDHFHNYGLYFYLTPNVQIDGRIGWRIGDHLDESLYGLGFSMRF